MNPSFKHINTYKEMRSKYPELSRAAEIMPKPPAAIIGRDINELRRGLRNPEKANVALLAEPGTGKTAYVQGFAYDEDSLENYLVLDVNPERLIEKTGDRDNALLNGFLKLLDQAGQYSKDNNVIVVLFIDEFHKMMTISPSLMESLKPRLEKSALNGFRLIAATTFEEYNETIAQNRALDQRFLQIKLPELPKEAVLRVLENRAKEHGVYNYLDKGILEDIYTESKRLLMSNAQPRASIDILNSMIGDTVKSERMVHGRLEKVFYTPAEMGFVTEKVICRPLLKRIIKRAHGVDIDNAVDVKTVINALKTRLYNQDNAIEIVVHLLEMAAHGLSDITRPKFSFLSTGSTGTGKAIPDSELVPAPVPDGYVRNGDLKPGDYVYGRNGKKEIVTDVFHKGLRTVYRVTLTDGRQIDCARDHLWTYKRTTSGHWMTSTTEELMTKNLVTPRKNGMPRYNYALPQNKPVEREARVYSYDPYVFGNFIGKCKNKTSIDGIPELINAKPDGYFIPDEYKFGSIEQRWALIQGLFDAGGYIANTYRHAVSFSHVSKRLVYDVQEVLCSLGVISSFSVWERKDTATIKYKLHLRVENKNKPNFFRQPHKLSRALDAYKLARQYDEKHIKKFDTIAIKSIEKLDYKEPMTCIMVDDDEHLYLAGKGHIVTHNTEMAKIITETMGIPLKRFDMSRFSNPNDAGSFADALFEAAWSTPNAYILIDEVEKSSKKAMNILLQVLDDARLTDSRNPDRVASFSGCIINLTTNAGSEVYQNQQKFQDASAEADAELVYKALTNVTDAEKNKVFETAVLGRIDQIVPFHPLPDDALEKIARRTLNEAIELIDSPNRKIIISKDIIPHIVKDRTNTTDTERGGARDAKRNVRNIVIQQLAHYLTYATHEVPVIVYLKGRPRFKFKNVADPMNAHVDIMECYPAASGRALIERLKKESGKPLIDKGLYFPANKPLQYYADELKNLIRAGFFQFHTEVDGEEVTIKGE